MKKLLGLCGASLLFTSCGVYQGDPSEGGGGTTGGLNAISADDVIVKEAVSEAIFIDILRNDAGFGKKVLKVGNGMHGNVALSDDGTTPIIYTPLGDDMGRYSCDWFDYWVQSANGHVSKGKAFVRFTSSASDTYEPDDTHQFARNITKMIIPATWSPTEPKTDRDFFIHTEDHTSDITNNRTYSTQYTHSPAAGASESGVTIGGDRDWFRIDVPPVPHGYHTFLKISVDLPKVAGKDHDEPHNNPIVSLYYAPPEERGVRFNELWYGGAVIATHDSPWDKAITNASETEYKQLPDSKDRTGADHDSFLFRELYNFPDPLTGKSLPSSWYVMVNPTYGSYEGKYTIRFNIFDVDGKEYEYMIGTADIVDNNN